MKSILKPLQVVLFMGVVILLLSACSKTETYSLHFEANIDEPLSSKTVSLGDRITTLPTPSKEGYIFKAWSYNGNVIEAPFRYVYENDITLIALWQGVFEGIVYEEEDDEIIIISYRGTETDLILPDMIEDLPVTKIADFAFDSNEGVESIVLGSFVEVIGENAFSGGVDLKHVYIPASVRQIGMSAFAHARELKTVTFEPGIQLDRIERHTFAGARSLKEIKIPASVREIGDNAFWATYELTTVTFESASQLEIIEARAFYSARSLRSIFIPESVEEIGDYAFGLCYSLTIYAEVSEKPINWSGD